MTLEPSSLAPPKRRRWRRRLGKSALVLLNLGLILLLSGHIGIRYLLVASLPQMDGELVVDGLTAPVKIERDAQGIPTILAPNRPALAYGLGFAHGQDRFFQMDLQRRGAAGELAELLGATVVEMDKLARLHRFRSRMESVWKTLPGEEREIVLAYAAGVNAGRKSLRSKPFEYHLLRAEPRDWKPEDSLLVMCAMCLVLQGNSFDRERDHGLMQDTLPPALAKLLLSHGSEWDAPLEGGPFTVPPLPTAAEFDLRKQHSMKMSAAIPVDDEVEPYQYGSNNWAVAGSHTAHGGAILANDMHLGFSMPNIWYRVSFVWPDEKAPGKMRRATGISLPGGPVLVVGSNGHIAWGFTNSEGDWADLIRLKLDPKDVNTYHTPDGPKKITTVQETIQVKGEAPITLTVRETVWGPIWDQDHKKQPLVLRWTAHDLEGMSINLAGMMTMRTLPEALDLANRCGGPQQNFVVADASGQIAWTILGRIPRRMGYEGRVPMDWSEGKCRWDGYLAPSAYPRIINPPSGRLWTANARVVGGDNLKKVGFGGYDRGARAGQIRDGLLALPKASEADMLKVHLDDRALFLQRWQQFLLQKVLKPDDPLHPFVANWGGRASADSVGFRIVKEYRDAIVRETLRPLIARCRKADPRLALSSISQAEGTVWQIINQQPPHLLPSTKEDWPAFLRSPLGPMLERLHREGGLEKATWGNANRMTMRHPISRGAAFLAGWLDIPAEPMSGAPQDMPRIQAAGFGASQRFAVSPGREAEGYFHMPGGQSGHPLSPHYRNSHRAWAEGKPTPFLPGPAAHVLTLVPMR